MIDEAGLAQTENGLVPRGGGWFVVNAREASWWHSDAFGSSCTFEGDVRFPDFGINIQVLSPEEPNCMYHGENAQEDFLVLAGECLLLIEGEERLLGERPVRDHDGGGTAASRGVAVSGRRCRAEAQSRRGERDVIGR